MASRLNSGGKPKRHRKLTKQCLLAGLALTAFLCATAASAGGRLIIKADELLNGTHTGLVMLPDGSVVHLMRLHVRALFEVVEPGDSIVYRVNADSIIVRKNTSPSELLLDEPLATFLIEPALFAGINVGQQVAIFDPGLNYFFSSFPGYPYPPAALDGNYRIIYVGNIARPYVSYQPSINPFQPDSDVDGVPDTADNCVYVANGPLAPDSGNNWQLDTNEDGFGNACDADLDNDLFINFLDLDLIRQVFFTNPDSPAWEPDADFNGDQVVNFTDLDLMRSSFFGPPGPSGLIE